MNLKNVGKVILSLLILVGLWYAHKMYTNPDRIASFKIPAIYKSAGDFSEGLAPVSIDGVYYGYINSKGEEVIPFVFKKAHSFSDGLALVMDEDTEKLGYINHSGQYVIDPDFEYADSFSEGFASVSYKDKYSDKSYIDKKGNIVFGPYSETTDFKNGHALVVEYTEDGSYNRIINKLGEVLDEWKQVGYFDFKDIQIYDYYIIHDDNKLGKYYANLQGDLLYHDNLAVANPFSEGLASIRAERDRNEYAPETTPLYDNGIFKYDKVGFINRSGKYVIEPIFDWAGSFNEGLAPVCVFGKYGYIDKFSNRFVREDDSIVVQFQDLVLKNALLALKCDLNNDDSLTRGELRTYSGRLDLSDSGITNLDGIQYFENISELDLSNNVIHDLDKVTRLDQLEVLVLQNIQSNITLNISKLINLTELDLSKNGFEKMPKLESYSLKKLDLSENDLTQLKALEQLQNIIDLNVSNNKLTSLQGVERLSLLKVLNIENNDIKNLEELEGLFLLEQINASHNPIKNVTPIAKLINLKEFAVDQEVDLLNQDDNAVRIPYLDFVIGNRAFEIWDDQSVLKRISHKTLMWMNSDYALEVIDCDGLFYGNINELAQLLNLKVEEFKTQTLVITDNTILQEPVAPENSKSTTLSKAIFIDRDLIVNGHKVYTNALMVDDQFYYPIEPLMSSISLDVYIDHEMEVLNINNVTTLYPLSVDYDNSLPRYGYINALGKWRIYPTLFSYATQFYDGKAKISIKKTDPSLDYSGNVAGADPSQFSSEFDSFMKDFYSDDVDGILYEDGTYEINENAQAFYPQKKYSSEIMKKNIDGKFGYVNSEDQLVIEPKYKFAGEFCEGLAFVVETINGIDTGQYINSNGDVIISGVFLYENENFEDQYIKNREFSNGLARVAKVLNISEGKLVNIGDIRWSYVLNPSEYSVNPYYPDTKVEIKYGFMNDQGKIVIPFDYDDVEAFHNGLAKVNNDEMDYYINKKGIKVNVENKKF